MAGIGFALRKLLEKESYTSTLQAYGYAGVISSGPWVLSIIAILLLGFMTVSDVIPNFQVSQFQTSVTFLIATSLIFSGFLQHGFTRYISDQLFQSKFESVLPNFNGALLVITFSSGILAALFVVIFMPQQTLIFRLLILSGFVLLCNIWVATNLLSGLKSYKTILFVFFLGYGLALLLGYLFRYAGLDGLLLGFVIGQAVLLVGILIAIYQFYPSQRAISLHFMKSGQMFSSLIWAGFFYNLGLWVDKFLFWYNPSTGQSVIGPLHASIIYDLPIFLAYLSIIPGMAVFLVRMETDFVEYYDKFYNAVRDGGTLGEIQQMRNEMVTSARQGIFDIIKIQAIAVLVTFVLGPSLLNLLGISQLYLHLLSIDVVAVGLQVVFLGLLNVFFYLDKRRRALGLTALFVVANFVFTSISIKLGAFYFGYGFAAALLLVIVVGMLVLDYDFEHLEYETFMLTRS